MVGAARMIEGMPLLADHHISGQKEVNQRENKSFMFNSILSR
jgi:hypothetical protein